MRGPSKASAAASYLDTSPLDTSPLDTSRFELGGGSTGILLLHGYSGSPAVVRPMGEFLASKGMRVVAPLLPGHGTSPEDLNCRTWREVAEAAADELYTLQGQCDRVFVGGLSMGGLLTLYLGQRCGGIAGLIPMAAAVYLKSPLRFALPVVRRLVDTIPKSNAVDLSVHDPACASLLWSYEREPLHFGAQVVDLMHVVRRNLGKIHQPLLVFHGAYDKTVPMRAAQTILERSGSSSKRLVVLANSGHCLTVDGERESVFATSWRWIEEQILSER